MADHGINVTRADTAVATPNTATSGIPFIIGTAPLSKATGTAATAGIPVLCTSYSEAVEQLGYDDDWKKYTLCEVMYYHFKLCQCQPVIFLPVGETAEAAEVAAAIEQIELCLTMFGIVPDLIMAPGFSDDSTVAAGMAAKAGAINGMFYGKALVDISAKTYTAAVQAKNAGTYDEKTIVCWPNGTLGNLKFHGSTITAGILAETDTGNEGIPYESPSNKTIHVDGLCDDDGAVINLTYSSALENKLLSKQAQIDKTTASLNTYEQRLAATGNALHEAGVDTTQLTAESVRLETEVDKLKDKQVDLKKTMDEAGEGAKGFGEKSVEALETVEATLATVGISKALGEIRDAYMDCINTAGDFEASMSNVEALSGATGEELTTLSDKAKEMGATTKFTAGESADALSYMALAGWDTQSMLEGISPVLNLAAAANMDLAQASDIVTDYLTAFGLKASDTTHFVDVMAYAMAHSNTNVIQLGEAYKACASTATSLGYSVEETTAVLATMANAGVKGGEAGTALNAIFTRLATNTKKCGDELANYGVNIYDAQGNMRSLSSILTGIAGVWGDLTDQEQANLAKTIAGTNQYSKLQTIMAGCSEAAAEGGQSFADYTAALNDCAGSADKMAGTMLDNMNGRLVLMQSAADGLKIAIGEDLTPTMSGLYDVGAQVLGWMQGFVEENPGVVKGIAAGTVTLGGLVGTLTAVSAGIKLAHAAATLFTGSLAGLAGPLTLASVAIAGTVTLVTALATSADATVPSVKELTSAARDMDDSMKEASASYDSTLSNMAATASVADQYISKLEAIEAATNGNTDGNAEYHDTLARLSVLVPSLADDIDLETNSIKGSTAALRQHTDAYVADAKAQARQEYLNTLYDQYNNVLVESAENETKLATAQAKVEKSNAGMSAAYDKLLTALGLTDEQFKLTYGTVEDLPWRTMSEDVQQLRTEYMGYSDDLVTARREVENYTAAVEQDQEAINAAEAEYQEASAAVDALNASQQSAADSADDVAAQQQNVANAISDALIAKQN